MEPFRGQHRHAGRAVERDGGVDLGAGGRLAVPARALAAVPAWYVGDILRGTPPPSNGVAGRIAYKTGTGYGHRDAWATGFDGAHIVGIWFGRPDGASVPGALGLEAPAPALFDAFARLAPKPIAPPPPPASALTVTTAELPAPLSAFRARGAADAGNGPEIAFPPDGARVDLGLGRGAGRPLAIRLSVGVPPFRWLVDGTPVTVDPFARQTEWRPDGIGFVDLAVIDATGRAARTIVFLQ